MNCHRTLTVADPDLRLRRFRDILTGRLCVVPDAKLPSMREDARRMHLLSEQEDDETILETFRQFAAE